ncbi:hypothetical protein IAE22_28425 [Bacillus sp. S34]|nr:hypothetical protein [Bacillus sp. S34]
MALCTLWLALAGHLDLYINPRYSVFTIVLAAVAVPASAVRVHVLRAAGTSLVVAAVPHVPADEAVDADVVVDGAEPDVPRGADARARGRCGRRRWRCR